MAEITLNALAHTYSDSPTKPEDYAIRQMQHVWHQGGAYALLGPSGCGKSTLLNIISGLLEPSDGEVLFDGKRVNELKPEERNIAQVFQFPVVYDTMTVYDNLAFPLRNIGVPSHKIRSKVLEVAEILELSDQLKRKAKGLSADQKQKVSMGRGLVRDDVSAILFDEPLTVIDPQLKWKLRRKLKQIHEQFNITMVYVTHDQLEASTFADKIAVMYDGQIVQFGTPRELFENPAHTFVGYFIGSPGMNFFNATFSAGSLSFGKHVISIHSSLANHLQQRGDITDVKVGIRPEFVHVWDGFNDDAYEVEVDYVEDLGTYKILSFIFNGITMKARLSEDQKVPVGKAYISFPEQWTKLYIDEYLVELGSEAQSEHESEHRSESPSQGSEEAVNE
ncbi:ABC transporter ATP-binding protein [Marinomonas mediterranea]|jgi:carbohydrate ABC transporter ATP-binding protein, CUT1 family (TC 3.A.1.1.-)|uniref:Glycerol-3-phosphate-transporting ATPase n=1 Tax=Marinomonas mediterranea (strain ATCC 700492 / JCM 21426 / NBRC 103028 / MMB-1) TaxID=717774 RepID=F2JYP9_MARM1|nr:ABC transporter ATP-binding protein [Marinomonas mediterranea]ADZ89674.1 Glycerol-3-phosphate-transporting ATPase [Marinomonas mediterranea MMB-1]WCN15911.1 ATP-binding cassette domain-containing protein [Marinomonas mediterranea MMB-1]